MDVKPISIDKLVDMVGAVNGGSEYNEGTPVFENRAQYGGTQVYASGGRKEELAKIGYEVDVELGRSTGVGTDVLYGGGSFGFVSGDYRNAA
jgi:hypothetical protein